jgi:transporter family protein
MSTRIFLLSLVVAVISGMDPMINRWGLQGVSSISAAIVRTVATIVVLFILQYFFGSSGFSQMSGRATFAAALSGGLVGIMLWAMYICYASPEVTKSYVIMNSAPLLAFIGGIVIFKDALTLQSGLGACLVVSGVYLLQR